MAFVIENKIIYQGFIIYDGNGKNLKEWFSPTCTESAKTAINKKFDLIPKNVEFTFTD